MSTLFIFFFKVANQVRLLADMRLEDIGKMKWNLPKRRKAPTSKGASKKSMTYRGKTVDKHGSAIEAILLLATPTLPSLTPLALVPIFVVALAPVPPLLAVFLPAASTPPCETRTQCSSA